MERVIELYATTPPSSARICGVMSAYNYRRAEKLIEAGVSFQTTQMCMLESPYICDYDRIIIHEKHKWPVTITNNHDGTWECSSTDRVLRYGNNLFKLWKAGEFDANAT